MPPARDLVPRFQIREMVSGLRRHLAAVAAMAPRGSSPLALNSSRRSKIARLSESRRFGSRCVGVEASAEGAAWSGKVHGVGVGMMADAGQAECKTELSADEFLWLILSVPFPPVRSPPILCRFAPFNHPIEAEIQFF